MPQQPTPSYFNYQIEKILGQGGMGKVYLAKDTRLNRKVAIKELNRLYVNEPTVRERFKNEAALLAKLKHPNIVALYEYVEHPDTLFLVMEYIEGIPLDKYLSEHSGPIPENKAIHIFLQLLEACQYAHEQNIIHRDIKPSNIILGAADEAKILDFGIAKAINEPQDQKLTRTGMRLGTLYYMSPEQIRTRNLDARSDIYSLGVTLFEMLTGKCPYSAELSEYDVALKVVNEPLPRAKFFYPNVPDYLQKIIDKATAKNPEDRFQTIEAMREALLNKAIDIAVTQKELNPQEQQNVVEWNFKTLKRKEDFELAQKQAQPNFADLAPSRNTPLPISTQDNTHELIEETVLIDQVFGKITHHYLGYYRGKDLFEKGQFKKIKWEKIEKITLYTNREIFSGVFLLAIFCYVYIITWNFFTLLLLFFGFGFAWVCFLEFPTITITKHDGKKWRMKGWPWQLKKAKQYIQQAEKVLENYL